MQDPYGFNIHFDKDCGADQIGPRVVGVGIESFLEVLGFVIALLEKLLPDVPVEFLLALVILEIQNLILPVITVPLVS